MFFDLSERLAIEGKPIYLSDSNAQLAITYQQVRDNVEALIAELQQAKNTAEEFYQIRGLDRFQSFSELPAQTIAARLIYLNRTCYNGLYRENSKGQFNAPFGHYKNPTIANVARLKECSQALQGTQISSGDFAGLSRVLSADDFIYLDPPYAIKPAEGESGFTQYTATGFDYSSQGRVADLCQRIDKKGAMFMLSNTAHSSIVELFKGFRIEYVSAQRTIASRAAQRGMAKEIIVRNY